MLEAEKIARIGELSRKSRSEGLSEAEMAEQKELREEYLAAFRVGFRSVLDSITWEEPKHGHEHGHECGCGDCQGHEHGHKH